MKIQRFILTALVACMFTSCVSYVQVYKTAPSDKLVLKNNLLVFEDENCKVSYNLWDAGGNVGFQFFNKTDKNIYLNKEESFFILNGVSYNYYKNRVFTNSTNLGTASSHSTASSKTVISRSATNTTGIITSSGFSVSYNEEKIVCIPSKTSKMISEYTINESLYRDCDLFKYPMKIKMQIKSKTFSKEQSPFIFSNRIAYSIEKTSNLVQIENEFYVTEITNYPEREICESKHDEYCGQRGTSVNKYYKNVSPDMFYINYSKRQDGFIH